MLQKRGHYEMMN